ncbi:hypothetical protein FN846DRAFT_979971 [Sphaerosporella brunnea]|uniref:Uncharacterized protein n=1 Tax=Sphaerosporella brunnea TaxID=1250544 RepID=A0A5J5EE02_9PEZI|nr:hypothetical protein FN846DRAFT_979971 [Sphaerosporella brunnea]
MLVGAMGVRIIVFFYRVRFAMELVGCYSQCFAPSILRFSQSVQWFAQSKKEQLAASYLAGQWKALQSLYYRETYERVSSATNQIMTKILKDLTAEHNKGTNEALKYKNLNFTLIRNTKNPEDGDVLIMELETPLLKGARNTKERYLDPEIWQNWPDPLILFVWFLHSTVAMRSHNWRPNRETRDSKQMLPCRPSCRGETGAYTWSDMIEETPCENLFSAPR